MLLLVKCKIFPPTMSDFLIGIVARTLQVTSCPAHCWEQMEKMRLLEAPGTLMSITEASPSKRKFPAGWVTLSQVMLIFLAKKAASMVRTAGLADTAETVKMLPLAIEELSIVNLTPVWLSKTYKSGRAFQATFSLMFFIKVMTALESSELSLSVIVALIALSP